MDKKKVEGQLMEFAREFGFVLPDGTFPQSSLFAQLVSTPHRCHLWDTILKTVQSKEKVSLIRKQILLTKLVSLSESNKNASGHAFTHRSPSSIEHKLQLWKEIEMLHKRINDKRKKVDELRDEVQKKAELAQTEVCSVAEVEKVCRDVKEKIVISKCLVDKQRSEVKKYSNEVNKIKSFGVFNSVDVNSAKIDEIVERIKEIEESMVENFEKTDTEEKDKVIINIDIGNRNVVVQIMNHLLEKRKANIKQLSMSLNVLDEKDTVSGDEICSNNLPSKLFSSSLAEQYKLDITENSLQAIVNVQSEKMAQLALKNVIAKIEKLMFNESMSNTVEDPSFECPQRAVDSFTGRAEKMSKFTMMLEYFGLKKRIELIEGEIKRIKDENERNSHWTSEKEDAEKLLMEASDKFTTLRNEIMKLVSREKAASQSVLRRYSDLVSLMREIGDNLKERNVFEAMGKSILGIQKETEERLGLICDMSLDAFRRINVAPSKEIFEHESLPDCLNNYGGELKDLFASVLLSPYEKPESIVAALEARKTFMSRLSEIALKTDAEIENAKMRLTECTSSTVNADLVERNYKEALVTLTKIMKKREVLSAEKDLIKKILKNWLEQPYRLMIPDNITVSSMTLRQYEAKYRNAVNEIRYMSKMNQTVDKVYPCKRE